jgi:hypothetical protein
MIYGPFCEGRFYRPYPTPAIANDDRIGCFKKAMDEYTSRVEGRLDDFVVPALELLRQLPGVARVDAPLAR